MSVILSDEDFKTVNMALLHAHHELSFVHGLHVTDLPDVQFTFDLDCSETTKLITDAILVLDKSNGGDNLEYASRLQKHEPRANRSLLR